MAKLKLTYPVFRHAAAVTCGTGSLRVLAEAPPEAVFLTSGAGPVVAAVQGALAGAGRALGADNHLVKPPGEPVAAAVEAGARFLERHPGAPLVVVGGGSVLDWGRLAAAAAAGLLDTRTGLLARDRDLSAMSRFWLVPTTCGTGAEAADVAVFALADGRKRAVSTPAFLATRVILDGRLLDGLPAGQLAGFVCDALSHAVEGYVSLIPLRLGKDAAVNTLSALLGAFPADPSPSRLERLMEAGFQGGIAAANCSVGIVHAAAHALAADGVGHGLGNACCLLDGLRFNAGTPALQSLPARLGLASVDQLAARLEPMVRAAVAGLPRTSAVWQLASQDYRRGIAARMQADDALRTNPRRPDDPAELDNFLAGVLHTLERLCPATS